MRQLLTDRIILHALERGRYLASQNAPFVWIDRLYIVRYLRNTNWIGVRSSTVV